MTAENISLKPKALIGYMVNKSKLSAASIAALLGRGRYYIFTYTNKGHMPTVQNLVQIAEVCGYEVHIIGHGEDITVGLEDE